MLMKKGFLIEFVFSPLYFFLYIYLSTPLSSGQMTPIPFAAAHGEKGIIDPLGPLFLMTNL